MGARYPLSLAASGGRGDRGEWPRERGGVEAARGDRARGSGVGGERGRDGDRWESG